MESDVKMHHQDIRQSHSAYEKLAHTNEPILLTVLVAFAPVALVIIVTLSLMF